MFFYFSDMAEHINIGDTITLTTNYGKFRGTVYRFDKMPNSEFSLKMTKVVEVNDENSIIPAHRFWKHEISDIQIDARVKTSPEKLGKQQWTTDNLPTEEPVKTVGKCFDWFT